MHSRDVYTVALLELHIEASDADVAMMKIWLMETIGYVTSNVT